MADYFGYIRANAGFEWKLLSSACFFTATYLRDGWGTALPAAGVGMVIVFPLGFVWWRRWGPRQPRRARRVVTAGGTGSVSRFHPWLSPVAKLAIALSLVLVAGLIASAAGLTAGSYVALIAVFALFAVVAPLFAALVSARHPAELRRRRR